LTWAGARAPFRTLLQGRLWSDTTSTAVPFPVVRTRS